MLENMLAKGFMPHGSCLLWREDLLALYVIGDSLTFLSYFLIPLGLVYLVRKRDDLQFNWMFMMFAAFIFFCGITHLLSLVNIWHSYYYIAGFAKLATGVVSTITAVMLWRLIPKALAIPTQSTLAARNRELVKAKAELEDANRTLETRVVERTRELERLAVTDSLTGLWNRREIMKRASDELARSNRYGHRLSVMMMDIDLFKSINDEHGHQVGDRVLEQVAQVIQTTCRQSDSVGRYGGEEFLLICPETDQQASTQLADRVRLAVAALDLSFVRVTCSIGVSSHIDGQTLDELIATADHALYAAKQRGRNQIAYE